MEIHATKEMVVYAFDSIMSKLDGNHQPKLKEIPKEWSSVSLPLFVTLQKGKETQKKLRGCIGTFTNQPLKTGLFEFARKSAFSDWRFSDVKESEMKDIHCGVSLLVNFEECSNIYDWEIGKHGIRIKFKSPENNFFCGATYLPEVAKEFNFDKKQTLKRLSKKAGFGGDFEKNLEYFEKNMKVTRYQSSKIGMEFCEYKNYGK